MTLTKKRILANDVNQTKFTRKMRIITKGKKGIIPYASNTKLLSSPILEHIDNYKLSNKIIMCNMVNSSVKDGIGNETENINPSQTMWNLYKVIMPTENNFKLLDSNIEYHIIHTKLNQKNRKKTLPTRPLVVVPGYSDKSICWTMGEMNRYLNTMSECFNKFSDIYIFNLENVKPIQEANKNKRDQLDNEIAEHLDQIIRALDLKNISLLGRSAGGGLCIHIARISAQSNNDYVHALNLACPGYKREGITDFITARMSKPIPLRFCWALEDTTVKIQEGYQMKQQLIDSKYITQGSNLLKFIEISTNSTVPAINHRVHKELIYMLE